MTKTHHIITGDCIEGMRTLPDASVHCCVTSPPYWGLRDYGHGEQIGLEQTPDAYVAKMVEVFREVRRVLRDDGTLWLNLGDSYSGSGKGPAGNLGAKHNERHLEHRHGAIVPDGLKPKDLVGIPWRVAFALQADGWYLRQDIIWHKPNPMPESVTDRCTKAHEYIFLLSKSSRYYYDAEAVKEKARIGDPLVLAVDAQARQTLRNLQSGKIATSSEMGYYYKGERKNGKARNSIGKGERCLQQSTTRNRRSVWTVTTQPYRGAHFATFPPKLIEPCILAGTSERGCCPKCGKPWERVVEKGQSTYSKIKQQTGHDWRDMQAQSKADGTALKAGVEACGGTRLPNGTTPHLDSTPIRTLGWQPGCECSGEPVPCTVLDPFTGSGTTAVVALNNGRNFVGTELNPDYVKLAEDRISQSVVPSLF